MSINLPKWCTKTKFILIKTKYYYQKLFEKIKIIIQKNEKYLQSSIGLRFKIEKKVWECYFWKYASKAKCLRGTPVSIDKFQRLGDQKLKNDLYYYHYYY